jgi:voltage-gated potassium channel
MAKLKLIVLRSIGAILSPTRSCADLIKRRRGGLPANFVKWWNWAFLVAAVAGLAVVWEYGVRPGTLPWWVHGYLWLLPFGRTNEIFYAFLNDGLDRIKGTQQTTSLTPYERILLAGRSYLEAVLNFSLLYVLWFRCDFSREFRDVLEAVYFSAVTITTVGYGDFTPTSTMSQLFVVYEIFVGLVLLVIAFGAYVGGVSSEASRGSV